MLRFTAIVKGKLVGTIRHHSSCRFESPCFRSPSTLQGTLSCDSVLRKSRWPKLHLWTLNDGRLTVAGVLRRHHHRSTSVWHGYLCACLSFPSVFFSLPRVVIRRRLIPTLHIVCSGGAGHADHVPSEGVSLRGHRGAPERGVLLVVESTRTSCWTAAALSATSRHLVLCSPTMGHNGSISHMCDVRDVTSSQSSSQGYVNGEILPEIQYCIDNVSRYV